jgi:hypothetical protein
MIRALIPESVNPLGLMLLVFVGVFLPILIINSATAGVLIPRWFEAAAR